jgi:hypothetical protein
MTDENKLAVVEQKEIEFYGDAITAVLSEDGTVYVPIRPICDALGVAWDSQRRRIYRDPILTEGVKSVTVTVTDIDPSSRRPHSSEMIALPLDYLNGWLFGMNADRVKSEIRERVLRYQRECYRVLFQAFHQQKVTAAPIEGVDVDELLRTGDDPEAYAYRIALAVANMARQQLVLRYQLQEQGERLDGHEHQLGVYGERLDQIEAVLGDSSRYISNAQASHISQAVKAIALEIGKRSGRNEFGGVYGELYRRFEIAGYRELPAGEYAEAMSFFRQWYGSLTDDGSVPF